MAHIRERFLKHHIEGGLRFKGIVGIFGHRQVGKTTLLELLSGRYTTLDLAREMTRVESNAELFLSELTQDAAFYPVAIDECQLAPALFPALKEFVRKNKRPGRFLLSGSVRFSSRKAIRESLTGRMLAYELLPFSVSELAQRPLNTLASDLMTANYRNFDFSAFKPRGLDHHAEAKKYLRLGGLPGICFVRNERDRVDLLDSQLSLILDRDLRLVSDTKLPLSQLLTIARLLAENQNRPLNLADLRRKTRVSEPTLRKVLAGLEAIFFIRQIPARGDETRPVIYLEDQGEAYYLASGRFDVASDLERLAYSHLRIPFHYTPRIRTELFQYRRQGGAYVPFVFRRERHVLGYICIQENTPGLSAIRSAQSLKQYFPGAKVIYVHPGNEIQVIRADEAALPIELFL